MIRSALQLLAHTGVLTTSGLARAANCSKESLYKWFGNRDGLLAAMITYQANKVRTFDRNGEQLTIASLHEYLLIFARDLLEVLAGDVSLALNRLAIGQTSRDGAKLGKLLLERGRREIDRRARALIEAGKRSGVLRFDDADEAYHMFYGLIVSDVHVRRLLGEPGVKNTDRQAEKAVIAFLRLYGSEKVSAEMSALGRSASLSNPPQNHQDDKAKEQYDARLLRS